MPSFCAVSACEFKYTRTNNVSFHKFPFYNAKLLDQWIKFTVRGPSWHPSRWSSICSRHFLPTDFRDNVLRKCLKRLAVPSIKQYGINYPPIHFGEMGTMESIVNESLADNQINHLDSSTILAINDRNTFCLSSTNDSASATEIPTNIYTSNLLAKPGEVLCRLCARSMQYSGHQMKDINDYSIMIAFTKCFPNIPLDRSDNLPKKICVECLTKLRQFSIFTDKVEAAQSKFRASSSRELATSDERNRESSKPLFIKQEPVVNVKQEIVDFNRGVPPEPSESSLSTSPIGENTESNNIADPLLLENDAFCEYCDVSFINNVELKHHIVNYHTSDRTELANNCEIMEIITLENACIDLAVEEEEFMLSTEKVLKVEHLSDYEHRENLVRCILSEHSYSRRSLYKDDAEFTHNEDTKKIFKVEEFQLNASNQMHPTFEVFESTIQEEVTDSPTILNCTKCTLQFDSQLHLDNHMKSFHSPNRPIICPICSIQCKSFYQYLAHKSLHRRWKIHNSNNLRQKHCRYTCTQCRQVFRTKLALNNHQQFTCTVRKVKADQCKYCRKYFKGSDETDKHMAKCRKSNGTKIASDLVASRIIDTFIACIQKSTSLNSLVDAAQSVKDTLVTTPICANLADSADCNANVCNSCTTEQISAKQQIDRSTNGGRKIDKKTDFVCYLCGRTYNRRCNLNRHLHVHRNKSEWDQKCKFCGMVFDKLFDLKRHFIRNECSALVNSTTDAMPIDLKVLIDTNKKTYECEKCNKTFRYGNNLYQHKLTHLSDRKFSCKLCPKVFKRSSGLNQHIKGFHENIKPHKCTICQRSYALKGDLKRCMHSNLKNNSVR